MIVKWRSEALSCYGGSPSVIRLEVISSWRLLKKSVRRDLCSVSVERLVGNYVREVM